MPRDVGVVVVAAGKGTRMGGPVPKQYELVAGVPVVVRALRPFVSHPEVGHCVVVLPADDAASPPPWLGHLLGAGLSVVAGGAARSDSVYAGLMALPPECITVLVHDAARPFVERWVIDEVIDVARAGVGALAAIPVTDTVKETVPGGNRVVRTVPREQLWRAHTPQGFPRALIEEAHRRARADGVPATDDAALVERIGGEVRVVLDTPRNFKITTPDDLTLARILAGGS